MFKCYFPGGDCVKKSQENSQEVCLAMVSAMRQTGFTGTICRGIGGQSGVGAVRLLKKETMSGGGRLILTGLDNGCGDRI